LDRFRSRVVDQLLDLLDRAGFIYETISYPEDKRSIDIVAYNYGRVVLFKITRDSYKLSSVEANDLRKAGKAYNASPIVVSEKHGGLTLDEDIVVENKGLYVASVSFLEKYVESGEKPYIYVKHGVLVARIDPVKFRNRREELGYSRGALADELGVSRKAIYEYESGEIDVSIDKAEKIALIMGEDVFQPIDIFETIRQPVEPDKPTNSFEIKLNQLCRNMCREFYKLLKTPIDYIIKKDDETISIIIEKRNNEDFETKIREATRITRTIPTREIILKDMKDLENLKTQLNKPY